MDFMEALAHLAQQHPSTPVDLGVEFHPELNPPLWVAAVTLFINDNDQPCIAEGSGATPFEALNEVLAVIIRL